MKTDAQLKIDVTHELEWDPSINATHVGVAVNDGVVILTGHLETFAEKHAIERAAQRVKGVTAVAVELDVKLAPGHLRSDSRDGTLAALGTPLQAALAATLLLRGFTVWLPMLPGLYLARRVCVASRDQSALHHSVR